MSVQKAKVDFMIIGAQKSATTTLFDILNDHPELCGCKQKEPEFFSHRANWREKVAEYENLYDKQPGQLAFEASTSYTAHPTYGRKVWEELWDYNPDLKFVYIVRDPLDRIISAHRFLYRQGYANKKDINAFLKDTKYHVNLSKYYFQIKPYIERFGAKNVKIVLFEDFSKSPEAIVNEILDFLHVNRFQEFIYNSLRSNTKDRKMMVKANHGPLAKLYLKVRKRFPKGISNMLDNRLMYRKIDKKDLIYTSGTLAKLKLELLPDIENFERLIKRDLSHWKIKFENEQ